MFLSDFSIKRPMVTVVAVLALMCFGLLALKNLKVNQIPDVEMPNLTVSIQYPGASPETVEREVINRIEKSLQSIPGMSQIESTSAEGMANIDIAFNFNKNMVSAVEEVRNAISSVRHKLPLEMREPIIQNRTSALQPILELSLSSNTQTHATISHLAEDDIANKLRSVDGVAMVAVSGALQRELSVLLHAGKLNEYNVSVIEVVNALRNENVTAPVGKVSSALDEKSIRLIGRIGTPEEFEKIVIKRRGDEVVRLGQVATISVGFSEPTSVSLRNGHPNVSISVLRSREASTVTLAGKIREMVAAINLTLPQGTKLEITRDSGKEAQNSLNNVVEALIFGAILTIVVVYVFLNSWRSTLITALSLPTSVVTAFIAVWACGFTLNFMTLLGLSLAIGVLIDDAIVVRENIMRHMEMGEDPRTAASHGTQEIGLAVAATSFSIIAVFVPVAFMPHVAGEWFRPFAVTVASSVLVSLFISFTVDPMLSAYWSDPASHHLSPSKFANWLTKFNAWFDRQGDRYGEVIAWALQHRRKIAVIAGSSFAGALFLYASLGGSSFLPATDVGMIAIDIRTPPGSNLNYAQLKVEKAAELARSLPETVSTNSIVNPSGGRVYVDIGKSSKRKRSAWAIAADLRKLMRRLIGAEYVVLEDISNGVRKSVELQFYGSDIRRLMAITGDFMNRLRKVPGAVDVGLSELAPKDELRIELRRGLASALGVSVNDVAQSLRVAFSGVEVGDWIDASGEAHDVAVRLHPNDRVGAENIERLPISVTGANMMVPLDQIANITIGKGPTRIVHMDGKRMISVSANVQGRSPGEVSADAIKITQSLDFPAGYGVELGGASGDQKEVFSDMGTALVMGIVLMYLVLVIQFNSFTAPVAVMLSLPLSLIGVVISLLVTDSTLNLMSLIGIIMLMGLVAKNAILLLDCARKLQAEGIGRQDALMRAGRLRLRPIMMTTLALIVGMLPVALAFGEGSEFYRPLAITIIGGTIASTVLTLLIVPTFYDSIEISRDNALAKFHARAKRLNHPVAFLLTLLETVSSLLFLGYLYRMIKKILHGLPGKVVLILRKK